MGNPPATTIFEIGHNLRKLREGNMSMNTLLTDQENSTPMPTQTVSSRPLEPVYVDVRTPREFETVHITGSINFPLPDISSRFEELKQLVQNRPIILLCRTQNRVMQAYDFLTGQGITDCTILAGGITEWIKEGKPVTRGKQRLSLEGQVRAIAGGLILLGVGLSMSVHWGFLLLPTLVGLGLLHAGLTDSCLMGMLLSRLPYNRARTS